MKMKKINAREVFSDMNLQTEVCIMGAGVAGITLASEFAKMGIRVVLLDAGGVEVDKRAQWDAKANSVSPNYPDPRMSRLRMLGGTSNHWSNNTSPLSSIDFKKRDGLPNSGWPIKKEDLDPYYKLAAEYCGTGGDGYDLDYWMRNFNVSPTINSNSDSALKLAIAKASVPPTKFFETQGQYLEESLLVTLIHFAQVTDVDYSKLDKSISKVHFTTVSGGRHSVEADEFIMAFGGIENGRMLSHFNSKNNNELGNQNDCVGRYFMDHPTLRAAQVFTPDEDKFTMFSGVMDNDYKRFVLNFFELSESKIVEEKITNIRMPLQRATKQQLSDGISSFHLLKERFSGGDVSGSFFNDVTNIVMDLDVVADTISRKKFNKPLFDDVNEFSGFQVPLMMEQTAHRNNMISLSNKKDRFGIPMLNINWQLHESDKNRLWRGLDIFAREMGAEGLGRVRVLKDRASRLFSDQLGFGHHHMGTTRMSNSPSDGVVNSEQLVFGTKNFSIAGSSVFPTGGHVPPTLTIVATSIRLSKTIAKRLLRKNNG